MMSLMDALALVDVTGAPLPVLHHSLLSHMEMPWPLGDWGHRSAFR